jgi:flavin reductase (DIM6/NTAB) family NADH-FMN oxidoreductase RutF
VQKRSDYGVAAQKRFPLPLSIAIAKTSDGRYNPITLGWWMNTSHVPPMFAISIGVRRYSLEVIRSAGSFVLSFPTEEMRDDTLYFGTHSGRQEDKIAARGCPVQPATEIDCVLLSEAAANFECVVESDTSSGDHAIFVGRVVASFVSESAETRRLYTLDRTSSGFRLGGVRELPS